MKTLFTATKQFNDVKFFKIIIRDELIQRYNDVIQIQRTIQINLNNAFDLQCAVYDEEEIINDYLSKAKLDICLRKNNDFLKKLN